jgi:2',3'-cyclic-nucleotide 2'-phosphodiesterase (5'-nucleotidase family)
MRHAWMLSIAAACAAACDPTPPAPTTAPNVTLSIVGTSDLHGHIEQLPWLGGLLANLRRARERTGGAVVLVDAGDMFQGTLESNVGEGAAVVQAYRTLGYDAVAVGNHEFDFGPEGDLATPRAVSDDPRGALKARAQSAPFPFLCANLVDAGTKKHVDWPNMPASVIVEAAGVKVGIVGVTTIDTPHTTIRANFEGLAVAELAPTIATEARSLRSRGAAVVVAVAHAGGSCKSFGGTADADGCKSDAEIFRVARDLPSGSVDVLVGGHTHAGIAHEVAGIAVIESFAQGKAFGRVDLVVERATGRVVERRIHQPKDVCAEAPSCAQAPYEEAPVVADAAVAAAIAEPLERTRALRAEKLGTVLAAELGRAYDRESPLGNLFADLIREALPAADVGLMNGGGLRADLPAGELTFGQLYGAFPFDNRIASVAIPAKDLAAILARHLQSSTGGILSISGVRATAACEGGALAVHLSRNDRPIADDDVLVVVASDFMLTGGDDFWGGVTAPPIKESDQLVRDVMVTALRRRPSLAAADVFVPSRPRLVIPGKRPVRCTR